MHPVQAAPRQSPYARRAENTGADAPRAGSAEAKGRFVVLILGDLDAPRAGSAEAKSFIP